MRSCDVSGAGRQALLDEEGRRLRLVVSGEPPVEIDLDFTAQRCRFRGESLCLLGEDRLWSLTAAGVVRGSVPLRADATDVAILPSGSLLVSYGPRGFAAHGVTLERLGPAPLVHGEPALPGATCVAAESGGFWAAGPVPAPRAVRFRPRPDGVAAGSPVALPAAPRALSIGPDGALYVLLEPGDALVRVDGGVAGPVHALSAAAHELARAPQALLACGPGGVADLTELVPPPGPPPPPPPLPPCS